MKLLLASCLLASGLVALQGSRPTAAAPEVGKSAPTVRLNDQSGDAHVIGAPRKSGDERWTVVAFYPKALTPG